MPPLLYLTLLKLKRYKKVTMTVHLVKLCLQKTGN